MIETTQAAVVHSDPSPKRVHHSLSYWFNSASAPSTHDTRRQLPTTVSAACEMVQYAHVSTVSEANKPIRPIEIIGNSIRTVRHWKEGAQDLGTDICLNNVSQALKSPLTKYTSDKSIGTSALSFKREDGHFC